MNTKTQTVQPSSDTKIILECIRSLIQSLRVSSAATEKETGLSAAQLFVLENLRGKKAMTLNELAASTLTHQSSVSVVVKKLQGKGFVKRSPNRNDLRSSLIELSEKGRQFIQGKTSSFHQRLFNALEQFSSDDRSELARTLHQLMSNAGFMKSNPPLFGENSAAPQVERKSKKKMERNH